MIRPCRPPLRGRRARVAGGLALLVLALPAALPAALPLAPAGALAAVGPKCVPTQLNASDVVPGTSLAVSPLPGSYDASPQTQISMLGAPAGAITGLSVRGSASGAHAGTLRGYSQGDGASFVPATPFRPGEVVTVRGTVTSAGTPTPFTFAFAVAQPDALAPEPVHHPAGDPNAKQHFRSRPDLEPPAVVVTAHSPQAAAGDIFTDPANGPGPSGPMILDGSGQLVWFDPIPSGEESTNLQVQQLDGRPVLTWWQGYVPPQGFGIGEEVIDDGSYRQLMRVRAGNGYHADLHDFHIGPGDTAVFTVFNPIACDLAPYGGQLAGAVTDGVYQEVDLRTGLVRREWHSIDHVPLSASYNRLADGSLHWPFDFFHINSVDETPEGATLVSARNTWALYEIETAGGRVRATIGGKQSTVALTPGAVTAFQHDAELRANGTISVFDNGGLPKVHAQSRALLVAVNPAARSGSVLAEFVHPTPLLAGSQGDVQLLANGDEFVGWGSAPYFSEFSATGRLLFDAHMHGTYGSYRAYRLPWTGAPAHGPAIAAVAARAGAAPTVYASWNGDTRTGSWRVLGGSSRHLHAIATAPRSGFETAIALHAAATYVAVQALAPDGSVLATSAVVRG